MQFLGIPAWGRWTTKKTVGGGDLGIFGDEKGCILLSTALAAKKKPKKPEPKKPVAKKVLKRVVPVSESEPPAKKAKSNITLTLSFSSVDELKSTLSKLE